MSDSSPAGGRAADGSVAGAPEVPERAVREREQVAAPTVFFLSDYGLQDEFVGVVHAVLRRLAPGLAVVDLTHGIAPFDVRGGAGALERALPHLGPGVVLAVVDPGVGSDRRGVAVRSVARRWFVGPDNGVLLPAVEADGGPAAAVTLDKPADAPATFDGRDVFAPAAAHLALGGDPAVLGAALVPRTLVALAPPLVERSTEGGRQHLRAAIVWCDHFGNLQLAVTGRDGPPEAAAVEVRAAGRVFSARRVATFSALGDGELGVLVDSTGKLALARCEGSAAAATGAEVGSVVELVW